MGTAYVGTVCWSVCIVISNPMSTMFTLTSCPLGNFHAFLLSADFVQNQFFSKNSFMSEYHLSVKQVGSRSG